MTKNTGDGALRGQGAGRTADGGEARSPEFRDQRIPDQVITAYVAAI